MGSGHTTHEPKSGASSPIGCKDTKKGERSMDNWDEEAV